MQTEPIPIVIGYDNPLAVDLRLEVDGVEIPVAVAPSATVQAALIDTARTEVLAGPVTAANNATGANWADGRVILPFLKASLSGLSAGSAILEISVEQSSSKTPWFGDVLLVRGMIG